MKNSFLCMMALALAGSMPALAAPEYVLSYIVSGSQSVVTTSGVIFPSTVVGATSSATIVVFNGGDSAGQITGVTGSGNPFLILGAPSATLAANATTTFIVSFTPTVRGPASGSLTINLDTGAQTIPLSGQGTGATFTVQNVTSGAAVPANGTLSFPNTDVGKNATVILRVTNSGDATGSITPAVVGSNFALTNVIAQQLTLNPGASTIFNVVFTPVEIGSLTAQLLISNNVSIALAGTGLGVNLTFTVGSPPVAVTNGGTIFFPNTVAGSNANTTLTITNTGNVATSLTSVGIPASAFSISSPLALPLGLAPGATTTISLVFAPNAVGTLTSSLGIDNQTFTLRGVGVAPASLPAVSFVGVGDTATPLQQPSVGLQLAVPYAQDLTGTLTLTFTPDSFADDPTIQFATGGRTVNFRIPANTVNAVFGTASQVQFSPGTVAGIIALTPTFTIGSVDVTPKPTSVKTILVAASAPVLRSLQIGGRTATSFELLITGYATSRSVSGLQLTFTPSAGSTLATTAIPVNSESAFSAWYQTASSQTVGSQFTASLTVNVNGNAAAIQSVSVSASNSRGTSAAVSVSVQ